MKNSPCILFSGNASVDLAKKIVATSDSIKLGDITHKKFGSGEWYCQFQENIRGADVFLLQSTNSPANDNLMQLLIMADAARRASAGRITAVIPYFGYARQDRKDKSRTPISAKLVMDMIAVAGVDRIVTMDLHAQQVQGFSNLPIDHLYFRPSLVKALEDKHIDVVVSPDVGGIKKAVEYAEHEKLDFTFINKKRINDVTVKMSQVVGDIKDKHVLILDDLTETASTLIAAASECKKNGANKIYCAVTHGCLNGIDSFNNLINACDNGIINKFYCSNTVTEMWIARGPWATIVDVGDLFAKAILGIHQNASITSLFQ